MEIYQKKKVYRRCSCGPWALLQHEPHESIATSSTTVVANVERKYKYCGANLCSRHLFCGDLPCTWICWREVASFGNTFPAVILFLQIQRLWFMYHSYGLHILSKQLYFPKSLMPDKHLCGTHWLIPCALVPSVGSFKLHKHTQKLSSLQTLFSLILREYLNMLLPSYLCLFSVLITTTEVGYLWGCELLFQFRARHSDGSIKLDKHCINENIMVLFVFFHRQTSMAAFLKW